MLSCEGMNEIYTMVTRPPTTDSSTARNLAIHIEHEFFGRDGPEAQFRDRYGREGRTIRGLTVEEHLAHLREGLIPLAERCGRVMREALAGLEMLRAAPSPAVERSRPVRISVVFEPTR